MGFSITSEKDLSRVKKLFILLSIPVLFLVFGIGAGIASKDFTDILSGLVDINLSPTILITDFIKIGGVEATFINVAIVGLINIYFMFKYHLKINGVLIAAFFTVLGFSFFGKNIYNIFPIYLGGYLYTKYQKISFKDIIVVIMFGTALAPMISEISFSGILHPAAAVSIAIITGIFIGFVIVPLSSHMLRFHDGYNLYNIGFTSGIIGTVLTSILRSFGITVQPVHIISEQNHSIIVVIVIIILIELLFLGLIINRRAILDLPQIFSYKGRLVTDFTHLVGYGVTFINMSLIGFLSLAYVLLIGGIVNGPVLAGIFTVIGFGAFGKHLKNSIPIVVGVIVTAMFFGYELNSTGIIISVLFSTTLAPIAGNYGAIVGFFAGVFHMILVTNVGVIHGGINLYNNGFSGGLVAGLLIPVVDAFRKE
ncbi:hypothetical protein acsn021_22350 [Anaerocolumna cellulosilytica]|uniref:Uncharacterized protein n=1 Tax=Anaerocolumna cellulosilytica TaxID=433286 RepID=A0A6S6QY55_9FIRM|nr:DUF1576 domain-containing protein [Anaerocolumna cellulosilytica]MBB5194119.1 hypothetical protein [Anaerocolumna cellulosilytica]BCJ94666.1 hypothetical protein acsn021_22350 [Anaerocolumna cellulosilytica]